MGLINKLESVYGDDVLHENAWLWTNVHFIYLVFN